MKYPILLLVVMLASCKKDDRTVEYSAACDKCYVTFQSTTRELSTAVVVGSYTTFPVDTIYGMDTVVVYDSTYHIGRWYRTVFLEHNADPIMTARNGGGSMSIRMFDNGEERSASGSTFQELIEL